MPNVLSKISRLKISLERRGHDFPISLDMGEMNDASSPYKIRSLLRFANRAISVRKLDRAYGVLLKAILAGSLEAIHDPLIELDLCGQIASSVLRIMFEKNNAVSRAVANDWVSGIIDNDLRSTKFADAVLEMTKAFGKDSPRRILAYKISAMCGNDFGRREYVRVIRAKREQLARDLGAIPDMRFVEWGRETDMGKLVPKVADNRRNPPGPPVVENVPPPAQNMIPAGAEAAAVREFVDFPVNEELNQTIEISDDEEENAVQAELQERANPVSETQDPQVDDSVMEVELTEASTVSELTISPVSNIIDV